MSSRNADRGGQRAYYRGIASEISSLIKQKRELRELVAETFGGDL